MTEYESPHREMRATTPRVVDFIPTPDPLLRQPRLDYTATRGVLGIPTSFETNSAVVLAIIEERFGFWPQQATFDDGMHIRIVVHDGSDDGRAPVTYISTPDNRLIVHSPGSVAVVDGARRESLAYVTTGLVADRERFGTAMVEAITFALLANFDRHPVHAAALSRAGRALLLAGPSGMGKSTLAYLAHAEGIHVLSDDRVWVQLEPHLRVWGGQPVVSLLPDACEHFPDLSERAVALPGSGAPKVKVPIGGSFDTTRDAFTRAVVCVLARGAEASLKRLSRADIGDELARQLTAGFDRFPVRHDKVIRALTANGGWQLTLSDNPRHALPFLLRMLDEE